MTIFRVGKKQSRFFKKLRSKQIRSCFFYMIFYINVI